MQYTKQKFGTQKQNVEQKKNVQSRKKIGTKTKLGTGLGTEKKTWNRKKKLGTEKKNLEQEKKKLGTGKKNLEQTKKLGTEIKLGTRNESLNSGLTKNCGLTIYYFPRFYMHVTCTLPVLNADIMFCKFCDAWMQEKYKFFPTCGRKASENNTTTCATTFVEQFPGVDCFLENLFSVGFLRNFQRETSL